VPDSKVELPVVANVVTVTTITAKVVVLVLDVAETQVVLVLETMLTVAETLVAEVVDQGNKRILQNLFGLKPNRLKKIMYFCPLFKIKEQQ
jgi:hypothetical protein